MSGGWADAREAAESLSAHQTQALELLAQAPLLWPEAICTLAGLGSRATGYRRLEKLVELRLVKWIRPPLREMNSPRLYHLTDLGVTTVALRLGVEPAELAQSRRLRAEQLLRELPGLPYLSALYELLVGLVPPGGRLERWVRPWRGRYRTPRAKALLAASTPAYAEVSHGSGPAAPYLLLADICDRPLESYRRSVTRLAGYRAYRRDMPDLVVATTSERRALGWEELLASVCRGLGTAELPGYVFTWEEVAEGLPGRIAPRVPARGHAAPEVLAPLPSHGGRGPLPRPVGPPLAPPKWAVLSPHDRELLAQVGRHPFLSAEGLSLAADRQLEQVEPARKRLIRNALLREPDPGELDGEAKGLTELTATGLAVVAAQRGLAPLSAAKVCGLSGGGPEEPFGQRSALAREAGHTLGVNSLFLGLYRVAADWRRRGFEYRVLEWWCAAACARGDVRPDGYGVLAIGPVRYDFELEYDRGTQRRQDLLAKFDGYRHERVRSGDGVANLLVVTLSRHTEERIAGAVLTACAGSGESLPVLITTEARVRTDRDGLLGRIWREPVDRGRRHWLVRPQVAPFGYNCPPSEPFARRGGPG